MILPFQQQIMLARLLDCAGISDPIIFAFRKLKNGGWPAGLALIMGGTVFLKTSVIMSRLPLQDHAREQILLASSNSTKPACSQIIMQRFQQRTSQQAEQARDVLARRHVGRRGLQESVGLCGS